MDWQIVAAVSAAFLGGGGLGSLLRFVFSAKTEEAEHLVEGALKLSEGRGDEIRRLEDKIDDMEDRYREQIRVLKERIKVLEDALDEAGIPHPNGNGVHPI